MSEFTGDYKEYASNADSKYSIAFAEADLNSIKGIRLWPNGSKKKCGYEDVDLSGKVVIEYTDYCYQNPRGEIDPGPYNKVSSNPDKYLYPDPFYYIKGDPNPSCPTVSPFSDPIGVNNSPKRTYMTGKEFAALGCCKVLEDLPVCLSTEIRVDIFPSIDAIGIPDENVIKPDCPSPITYLGECREYEAKVFSGDEPAQSVTWSIEGGTSTNNKISSTDPNGNVTFYKAKFCVSEDELSEQVMVKACSTFDNKVCGYSVVKLKPRIIIKLQDGIDGFVPCQLINIDAWIFGGGIHQELNLTVSTTSPEGTEIIKTNDNKYQLRVSCDVDYSNIEPIRIMAQDITGYNFKPTLEPMGNGGTEYFDIPKKWISIEDSSSTIDSIVVAKDPNTVLCAECGSTTTPGSIPCGATSLYKAWMNWGSPCNKREDITDKVAWTIEGAVNSNTTISMVGSSSNRVASYRRGGNRYGTNKVVISETHDCDIKTGYFNDPTTGPNTVVYEDCQYIPVYGYDLIEPCEPGNVKIVVTSNEQLSARIPILS